MTWKRVLADGSIESAVSGFRYTGSTAPDPAGWSENDVWLDTSTLTSSVAATIRIWTGAVFWPLPVGSPALGELLDSFDYSGADGALWGSKSTLGRGTSVGTGAAITLLSGTGLLQTSNAGAYNAGATVARRLTMTNAADVNIEHSFKFDATECFFSTYARHDTDVVDGHNAYGLNINPWLGNWDVTVQTDYVSVRLGSLQTKTFTPGVWYRYRFRVVGTAIKARVWNVGTTEPGTWGVDTTDSTYTAAGRTGFALRCGAAATPSRVFLDDRVVRDS